MRLKGWFEVKTKLSKSMVSLLLLAVRIILKVAITGDSIVRRMRDANDAANNFWGTKSVEATFYFKGGAMTKWLWRVELYQHFDCITLGIGSNELPKCTIEQLQDSLNHYADYLIQQQFTCNVIIMGLWPRKSPSFSIMRGCSISLEYIKCMGHLASCFGTGLESWHNIFVMMFM